LHSPNEVDTRFYKLQNKKAWRCCKFTILFWILLINSAFY